MPGKSLIMGLCWRMSFDQIEKFLASLRRTAYRGDLCLFVDDVPPDTIGRLLALGIMVERTTMTARPELPLLSSRFFSYLDFLACHADEYANVMLSDIRDVVFQSDPFAEPLPAEIVFAQERCLIGGVSANHGWIVDTYGNAVAHNMRDSLISCAGTTFGTASGMLRYLIAMVRELRDRPLPLVAGADQAVHNYIVRMRPLRDAWFDTTDSLVATMGFVPNESIQTTARGVQIDGKLVPVLHQWDRNKITSDYVWTSQRFKLEAAPPTPQPAAANTSRPAVARGANAIVAFYHRPRDAAWLTPFLGSLRCAGFADNVHCVGVFNDEELTLLGWHRCVAHPIEATDPSLDIENIAHLFLSRVLDQLAADATTRPDQVLAMDSVQAGFQRDPFNARTLGLSVFCESATRIGESKYNRDRLAMFAELDAARLQKPIISSVLLRGPLDVVREFYRRMFIEFVGRAELMRVPKTVQGAINKLCHDSQREFPVVIHPNAAEVYFDFWPCAMTIDTTQGVRIGGATPAIVLSASPESTLIQTILRNLGLLA